MTAKTFRLLESCPPPTSSRRNKISVGGQNWQLTEWKPLDGVSLHRDFVCISYSWGGARIPHPLDERRTMSARVFRAIEAAQESLDPEALWIDAFCVPLKEPARRACLQQLGAIYASATQVCIVLSSACKPLLDQVSSRQPVTESNLLAFARDDWVTRAWTYQEVVNSNRLRFVTSGGQGAPVEGSDLLTEIAKATDNYQKARGHNFLEMRALHPRLSALEDLLVDWKISESQDRGAYQVMSNLARRTSERPEDRFSAMLGAVSETIPEALDLSKLRPAECFMRVCEAKGDFSFIYSTAPRDDSPGRCWRPIATDLPPILPYLTVEGRQEGQLLSSCLELSNMATTLLGPISKEARRSMESWLAQLNRKPASEDLPATVLGCLREVGFTGRGRHLELNEGYFFPQHALSATEETEILVARGVRWTFGAVALAIRKADKKIKHLLDVGVFVGRLPKLGGTVRLGADHPKAQADSAMSSTVSGGA